MNIKKSVRVILIDDAKKDFVTLNEIVGNQVKAGRIGSFEMKLLKSIKEKVELIKDNPFYGDNIKKKIIPKIFDVPNLWRAELNNYWRMLYTIRGNEIEVVCFVLKFSDHKEYNKLFGYK